MALFHRYDEDSEVGEGEESDVPASFYMEESSGLASDSDDEDEDDDDPASWFHDDQDDGIKGQNIVYPDAEDLSDIIRVDGSRFSYNT